MKNLFTYPPYIFIDKCALIHVFLVLFFLFSTLPIYPSQVDDLKAKRVAINCLAEKTDRDPDRLIVLETFTEKKNGFSLIHIYNFKNGGYVLVAADDVSRPIIGYSETGKFQQGDHSPAFLNQLNIYKEQIYYAIVNNVSPFESAEVLWEKYDNGTNLTKNTNLTYVMPLLTTTWAQGEFYNAFCPEDINGPDGHALVGCVAVAMGQVLNYWSHPWYGSGSHGYTHEEYGYLSADFQNTLYNYDSLPDVLSDHNDDVATLLYHCGVSVEMDYGPGSSGAWGWGYPGSEEVHNALIDYFYFSSSTNNKARSSYPIDWVDMIKAELDLGRPVIYGGNNLWGDEGHAWVVDGYSGDFFHMNWGWNGTDDGSYTLDDLTPSIYNFNEYNSAIFGAEPKSGTLSGTITLAQSPFELHYNYEVPSGEILIIEPGVEMIFRGRYSLSVEGQLEAFGTASDTIVFTGNDPIHGWGGLQMLANSSPDSSRFRYCKFADGVAYHKSGSGLGQELFPGVNNGGAVYCTNAPAVSFSNCLFTNNWSHWEGGSIYCENGSDILIKNSIISWNKAGTQGGGLSIVNSSPIISGTKIHHNENQTSGGGICQSQSTLTLINDSIFLNKSKWGGGIACQESTLMTTNVQIDNNSASNDGGGVYCHFNSSLVMNNATVSFNSCNNEGGGIRISSASLEMNNSKIGENSSADQHGGGIMCGLDGNVQLINVLIYGNTADSAGGVFIKDNTAFTIENVTISRNIGSTDSHEVTIQDGNFTSKNSIIWHTFSDELRVTGSSNLNCTYSAIQGGDGKTWFGTGCIDIDPQFTLDTYFDFSLRWDQYPEPAGKSPCIDGGDPSSPFNADGTLADMGAIPYEQVYTPLSGGDINGTLYCSESPYYVMGDLTVPSGEELIIEPCVYLVFRGDYKLNVAGRLLAEGTESQKIGFMPSDTIEGWRGIRFLNINANGQDSSKVVYSRILYGNSTGYYENGQGGGIYARQSSKLRISDSYFFRNRADTHGGGIYLTSSCSPLIWNCSFYQNQSVTGGGIGCYGTVNALIRNCIFAENSAEYGGAISVVSCAPVLSGTSILKNHASKFGGGIYVSGGQVPVFNGLNRCNIYDNYAELAGLDFYSAADVYTPPVAEVFLDSGSVDLFNEHFAYPFHLFDITSDYSRFIQENSDLYVSPSGSDMNSGTSPSDPLLTIKRALNKIIVDSSNPRTIHLANGTYSSSETGEFLPINHRSHVTLSGESKTNTIIDGDNLFQLLTSYADINDSITNLSFRRGYKDGDGGAVVIQHFSNPTFHDASFYENYSENHGGAVWCYDHSSPTFSNVFFVDNYSDYSGGAVYSQTNDTLVFDHVLMGSNTARHSGGGIHAAYDDYCWIRSSDFIDNEVFNGDGAGANLGNGAFRLDDVLFDYNRSSSDGGGLFGYGLDLEVNNSSFTFNDAVNNGGGFYFYQSADVTMQNVIFNSNSSVSGGAIWGYLWSTLNIKNGLFMNNSTIYDPYSTGDGGAMNLRDVETSLTNVTVAGNVSDGDGAGLFCRDNTYTIQNSVFWGNSPDQIQVYETAVTDVQYSDIEGTWAGTGNIDEDPLFTNSGTGDYSLQEASPCINTGNPDTTGMKLPYYDLAGSPRVSEEVIDMGAYEYFNGLELDLKVFLQGPFNGTDMNTGYMEKQMLTFDQPFSGTPWNYEGLEEVLSFPEENIVDWLLLEVRDATDIANATPETVVGKQAVFLLDEGSVVDINGNAPRFGNPIENQCFLVIRHRNHTGIISAYPLSAAGYLYSYNFTAPEGQAYGTDAQIQLGTDIYGMYGGDGNADGTIDASDKTSVWDLQAGHSGYLMGDFNLDGRADNRDKNDIWLNNSGQGSQVPE